MCYTECPRADYQVRGTVRHWMKCSLFVRCAQTVDLRNDETGGIEPANFRVPTLTVPPQLSKLTQLCHSMQLSKLSKLIHFRNQIDSLRESLAEQVAQWQLGGSTDGVQ